MTTQSNAGAAGHALARVEHRLPTSATGCENFARRQIRMTSRTDRPDRRRAAASIGSGDLARPWPDHVVASANSPGHILVSLRPLGRLEARRPHLHHLVQCLATRMLDPVDPCPPASVDLRQLPGQQMTDRRIAECHDRRRLRRILYHPGHHSLTCSTSQRRVPESGLGFKLVKTRWSTRVIAPQTWALFPRCRDLWCLRTAPPDAICSCRASLGEVCRRVANDLLAGLVNCAATP